MAFNVTTVIKKLTNEEIKNMNVEFAETQHLDYRKPNIDRFKELGFLNNNFVVGFLVDKEDRGFQYHLINNQALIYVVSMDYKIITILGARSGNIYRYYNQLGLTIDKTARALIDKAYDNCIKYDVNIIDSNEGVSIKDGDIEISQGKRKEY